MTPKSATQVRVRIAPSPTGFMHIGTARTALFNWLFAKKHNGIFVLRIEDTDESRSTKEFESAIFRGFEWLNLTPDEGPDGHGSFGPYRQSERGEIYRTYTKKLLDAKKAYYCFCSDEELEAERQAMLAAGRAPKYSGKCRALTSEEQKKAISAGKKSVIRFVMPEEKISVEDMVRGKTVFDMALVGDIVIAKREDAPLYNFAVVIDDAEMKISHVIRGEEHFTNTPKQIALAEALGLPSPKFAHIPLILNADRSKMSKREGAVSVEEYEKLGYLPGALLNFLALLGWHPLPEVDRETGKVIEREIFTLEELVERFDLERVQKGGAIFNAEKLDWLNAQYLKQMDGEKIAELAEKIGALPSGADEKVLYSALSLVRERIKKLTDIPALIAFFFKLPEYNGELLVWKKTSKEAILENLKALQNTLEGVKPDAFEKKSLDELLTAVANERGRGEVFWPLRVALSGQESSPGPSEIMEILGKKEAMSRINTAIKKLYE